MDETAINWDSIPDIITKDQLYQICHISKSTALYLLRSGKIPCEYAEKEDINEQLKAADPMAWVRRMNNNRNRAMEVVNSEVIFV